MELIKKEGVATWSESFAPSWVIRFMAPRPGEICSQPVLTTAPVENQHLLALNIIVCSCHLPLDPNASNVRSAMDGPYIKMTLFSSIAFPRIC
jgi:hypothetical protein